ncbi:hypothetical protein [Leptolyngbya ohadii]|uniref:hypothetical protein n=1 Tax=Leptolyngbya ohadii TaxID=1962290 RepID=UPI000B59EC53|nr:hypothetical protein [Leptolyngbya ohadii]
MNSNSSSLFNIRLRFRYSKDQHFASVLDYLEHRGYVLQDVFKELIKARFAPAALQEKGKLNQAIALECIGKLRGYIYEIEQLAGIKSGTEKTESHPILNRGSEDSGNYGYNDHDDELEPDDVTLSHPPAVDFDSIDRMLGFTPSRSA